MVHEIDRAREYAGNDAPAEFVVWLRKVDSRVHDACGLSLFDLPDLCLMDLFEAETSPFDAAQEAIEGGL